MKKTLFYLFIASCLLSACSKEKSLENSTGTVKTVLLTKIVTKLGTDSLTTSFAYDGNNRLITYSTAGILAGNSLNSQTSFKRNNDGIIEQVIIENSQNGSNDVVYNVNYSTADARYTAAVRTINVSGVLINDSIAYNYDNSGRIIKVEEFYDDGNTGGYAELLKNEFTLDGNGSITKDVYSEYDPAAGDYAVVYEDDYEYDAKVNPLKLSIEAFFVGVPELTSNYNTTKKTTTNNVDPTQNGSISNTYTYNQTDRPDSAVIMYQGLGVPINSTYYYQ